MVFTTNAASASAGPSSASAPAPRRSQGGRKKVNPAADDAAYHGTSASHGPTGTKRSAAEKADGEPRVKRKRIDAGNVAMASGVGSSAASGGRRMAADRHVAEPERRSSLVDFASMPTMTLYHYLAQYDLIPEIFPSPLSPYDPPQPSSLLHPRSARHSSTDSPAPQGVTPTNRPRRETSVNAINRRRSSRLLEEERRPTIAPVQADVVELHKAMAAIAEKHFRENTVRELDTLTLFAAKAKGEFSCLR